MADLLGTNRPAPSEERTVDEETADADAFEGLPVGGSLDEAARAMRVSPAAAPTVPSAAGAAMASSSAGVVPDVGGEDPLTLALRIAHQAQEQAAAAALEVDSTATVDDPPAKANGNGAHPEEPSPERTAPGTPFTNGNAAPAANGAAAGSQVGVIPDEPDNEDTVRARANATQSTVDSAPGSESTISEPTLPSESDLIAPDTSDSGPVIGEETPALTEEQRASLLAEADAAEDREPDTVVDDPPPARIGAVPDSPSTEATPSAPRPPPLAPMPEEPREEPTIRKTSPPPALHAPARLAPRTGTGPSGIGALGFRISSNRPVVRPAFNGRPSSPGLSTPAAGTPMTGSTAIERPSERVSIERPLADRPSRTNLPPPRPMAPAPSAASNVPLEPPPVVTGRAAGLSSDESRPAVPVWLLGVGVGLVAAVIVALVAVFAFGGKKDPPVATPTPVGEASATPEETATVVVALPTTTVALPSATKSSTPVATVTAAPTRSASTPTPTAVAMSTKQATPTPAATPAATAKPAGATPTERINEIVRNKKEPGARAEIYLQARNTSDIDFLFEAWKFLAQPPTSLKAADSAMSKKYARELGLIYLKTPRTNEFKAGLVRQWIEKYESDTQH